MQSSLFTTTALAVQALQVYGPRSESDANRDRVAKAKAWLLKTPATTSDDMAFQLLGLKWAGASADERAASIDALLKAQRPDGGWGQVPGMRSDAYATGQALYALSATGFDRSSAAFKKGSQFLLRTQEDDGTWFTPKRAMPANNYFDAAFPYGESQYASFNATAWATLALLETLPKK